MIQLIIAGAFGRKFQKVKATLPCQKIVNTLPFRQMNNHGIDRTHVDADNKQLSPWPCDHVMIR